MVRRQLDNALATADFVAADGDKAGGWASWWSASGYGYTRATHGDFPVGDSFHVSSHAGATVSLRFRGV